MSRKLRTLIIGGTLFLVCAGLAVPDPPTRRVNDWGEMISPAVEAELEQLLAQHERETSNQVVIATFPSLEGDSLERFSIKLAERWKVGQAGKDNGVILLAFRDDRKLRIEVGYGLEAVLPDGLAGMIIRNEIAPRFKAGDYDGGFRAGTNAILAAIRGAYRPSVAPARSAGGGESNAVLTGIFVGGIFFILPAACVILLVTYSRSRPRDIGTGRRSSRRGDRAVYGRRFGSDGWLGGGGSDSSGGDSGGGFSGGGGSFGGGGASGGW